MGYLWRRFIEYANEPVRVVESGPVCRSTSDPMPRWHAWLKVGPLKLFALVMLGLAFVLPLAVVYERQVTQKTTAYIKQECPEYNFNNPSDIDRLCAEYAGRVVTAKRNTAR